MPFRCSLIVFALASSISSSTLFAVIAPACCPSSKRTEALLCALLQSDLRLGLLPHLFSSP